MYEIRLISIYFLYFELFKLYITLNEVQVSYSHRKLTSFRFSNRATKVAMLPDIFCIIDCSSQSRPIYNLDILKAPLCDCQVCGRVGGGAEKNRF